MTAALKKRSNHLETPITANNIRLIALVLTVLPVVAGCGNSTATGPWREFLCSHPAQTSTEPVRTIAIRHFMPPKMVRTPRSRTCQAVESFPLSTK